MEPNAPKNTTTTTPITKNKKPGQAFCHLFLETYGCIHIDTCSEDLISPFSGRRPVPPDMSLTNSLQDPYVAPRRTLFLGKYLCPIRLDKDIPSDCPHLATKCTTSSTGPTGPAPTLSLKHFLPAPGSLPGITGRGIFRVSRLHCLMPGREALPLCR